MSVEVDELLADVVGVPVTEIAAVSGDTPLLGGPYPIDSATGARLLALINERLGVDIAGEDLNLDSLASYGSLRAYVAAHR